MSSLRSLWCMLFLAVALPAQAATYYVATTGDDTRTCATATTLTTPLATIDKGLACLSGGGDTLSIRAGTYNEIIDNNHGLAASGTSWASPITITAYPGETVTALSANILGGVYGTNRNYILFKDLHLTAGAGCAGVVNDPGTARPGDSYVRYQNIDCSAWNGGGGSNQGYYIFANHVEVIGGKVHDGPSGTTACGTSADCHGLYISGASNLVDGVEVSNVSGYGIHVYNGYNNTDAHDNTIRNNRVHNNGISPTCCAGGITLNSGDNNLAYNNLAYNNLGNGVESILSAHTTQMYNNTTYGNTGHGIDTENGGARGVSGTIITNNLAYEGITDNGTSSVFTTNLCLTAQVGKCSGGNPMFVNTAAGDFHVLLGSAAVDAGTTLLAILVDKDGWPRPLPSSGSYDIGAYEYDSALVLSFNFNEGSGTTANDATGRGNTGTLNNNPTWVTGEEGNALSFNGTNQYVHVPHSASLDITSTITISAWLKAPSTSNSENPIVAKHNGGTSWDYELYLPYGGYLNFFSDALSPSNTVATTAFPTDGNWHHVALTRNSSGTVKFWLDGVLAGTTTMTGTMNANNSPVDVGCDTSSCANGTTFGAGSIDAVHVYNQALSAAGIALDMTTVY